MNHSSSILAGNDFLDAVFLAEGIDGIDTVSGNAGNDAAIINGNEVVAGVEQLG